MKIIRVIITNDNNIITFITIKTKFKTNIFIEIHDYKKTFTLLFSILLVGKIN